MMSDDLYAQFGLPEFCVIDGYVIDAFVREEHSFESEVTNLPIESGSSTVDNVWTKPAEISVEGIVSSTPLEPVASQRSDPQSAPSEAYQKMLAVRAAKKPVTVITSLDNYTNMMFVGMTVTRGPGEGGFLRFSAKFQQADFVSVVKAKPAIPTARPQTKKTKTLTNLTVGQPGLYRFILGTPENHLTFLDRPPAGTHLSALWWDDSITGWRWNADYDTRLQKWIMSRSLPYGFDASNFQDPLLLSPSENVLVKQNIQAFRKAGGQSAAQINPLAGPSAQSIRTNDVFTANGVIVAPGTDFPDIF